MSAKSIAMVSFATRPGKGSEGGVGWAFIEGAIATTRSVADLHLVIDQRDYDDVVLAVSQLQAPHVSVHPVSIPRVLANRVGDRRTRASYLLWRAKASKVVFRIHRSVKLDVVHQVTFASAVLPPVRVPTGARGVWGPVSVPSLPAEWSVARLAAQFARAYARRNSRRRSVVLATNDEAFAVLANVYATEPNIVVEPRPRAKYPRQVPTIAIVGLLVPRKRPWLAVEAIADPALGDCDLLVIGSGPLRAELEALSERLGVAGRVKFMGEMQRSEVLEELASVDVLVHPSAREGACWVVGEAAAVGVPAVVFTGTGAETAVRMSNNGGEVVDAPPGDSVNLAVAIARVLKAAPASPSQRWSAKRLPVMLADWWGLPG